MSRVRAEFPLSPQSPSMKRRVTTEQGSKRSRFKRRLHVVNIANGVPNIATIDLTWNEACLRPSIPETQQAKCCSKCFFTPATSLFIRYPYVFPSTYSTSCFMYVRLKTNASNSYLFTVIVSTTFATCRSSQDWASRDLLYFTPIYVSCRSP